MPFVANDKSVPRMHLIGAIAMVLFLTLLKRLEMSADLQQGSSALGRRIRIDAQ